MSKKNILLGLLLFIVNFSFSQNYFTAYRNGEKHFSEGDHTNAVVEFTKVIDSKSDHDRAFNYRGKSYEALGDFNNALTDFIEAIKIKSKEAEYQYNLGRVYYKLKKFNEANEELIKAIDLDKKLEEAYQYRSLALMELKKFDEAVLNIDEVIAKYKSTRNYYLKGVAQDSLMNYKDAAYSFSRAIFFNKESIESILGLAFSNFKLGQVDKAIENCNNAISKDANNIEALILRAQILKESNDLQGALTDLSKIVSINPNEKKHFINRAKVYQDLNQHQNAISDFSSAIKLDDKDCFSYYMRAKAFENMMDYKSAIKDYSIIKKIAPYDGNALKLYDEAKQRLYDLNKESNKPKLSILNPHVETLGKMPVAKGLLKLKIEGQVFDESLIDEINVNNLSISFLKDSLNPIFKTEIEVEGLTSINFSVKDIYNNVETFIYDIIETEVNKPEIKLIAPYASDDGTIYLDADDPSLYIEGVVKDESLIKRIVIEESTASFVIDKLNPTFSANINILNKQGFKIVVEDIYGNIEEKQFNINRENIALLGDNPMGKTWVIFIENSNYKTFASLDGPQKDVTMMKSAFAKYKIHNIIHKSNLTKSQLEKFFSIELRDLVRSNRVNSILVWYAGHGKFINESGYWIPVDAKRDEEFTYFNINNLKAAMQSYSKYITHTLVVTDACESGPSFYQAMRSTTENRSCNDWQATKFKSSQVFSSAGYELAVDNSQFTKTFASALSGNPDSCIPIETIVTKVSSAVQKNSSSQKPKFGKIAGLEDENGTFFFIKK